MKQTTVANVVASPSIPIWAMLTKWESAVDKVRIDKVEIDKVEIDKVGIDKVGIGRN